MPPWYGVDLPILQLPASNMTNDPSSTPVFRTSTECPIPNEWLIASALVGLALGYVLWGRR